MDSFAHGNASVDGHGRGGWYLGHMVPGGEEALRSSSQVEVKWGVHAAGSPRKGWVANTEATTLSVLVRGRFRILFPEADVLLEREGDYALWPPGLPHHWVAEDDSVVLTVRWPSRPEDSREVEPPAPRLGRGALFPTLRPGGGL